MALLPSLIGFRYSHARRGSNFISLNAILAITGITIGIAALIVVLSVMNGVVSEVRDKMLAMTSPLSLRGSSVNGVIPPDFDPGKYLTPFAQVKAYAPYVEGQGLIGDGRQFQGVMIQGVDANEETSISATFAKIDPSLRAALAPGSFGIILGKGLADHIGAETGDKITVIVPKVTTSAVGLLPRLKRFTLLGTFSSGHYQYDNLFIWINLEDAAKLLQLPPGVSGYHLRIDDPMKAPLLREKISSRLPYSVYASDWSLDNAAYFNAVQTEKHAMFIILCLIVIVAAFGLLSSMYMVVTEKRRDIAILRTMGMSRAQIRQIFLTQGMTFGGLGILLGIIVGIILSLNVPNLMILLQKTTGYELPAQLYFISQLRAKVDPMVVIAISLVTLVLTLLFSVIPARIAARTEPARALSHE